MTMATTSKVRSIITASSSESSTELRVMEAADQLARDRFFSGLGPLVKYLDDPRVTNLHINADSSIYVERFGDGKFRAPESMEVQARKNLLMTLANQEGGIIDHLQSSFKATMPYYGSRVRGFAPPIGGWDIVIRQHGPTIALEQYLERGLISNVGAAYLEDSLRLQRNIVVAGPMNSGKTALVRALIRKAAELRPMLRPVVIQSDRELLCTEFGDKILLMARVPQAQAGLHGAISHYTYEFPAALEDALQTNAGLTVWGELRDGLSAVALTMALNTGSRGFLTTIHSDNPEDTLSRLEDLISFTGKPVVRRMMAKFVNVICYMNYDENTGRRWVSDIVEVTGITRDTFGNEEYRYERVNV